MFLAVSQPWRRQYVCKIMLLMLCSLLELPHTQALLLSLLCVYPEMQQTLKTHFILVEGNASSQSDLNLHILCHHFSYFRIYSAKQNLFCFIWVQKMYACMCLDIEGRGSVQGVPYLMAPMGPLTLQPKSALFGEYSKGQLICVGCKHT